MVVPSVLAKGHKVALLSTARAVFKDELQEAVKFLENIGLEVIFGNTIGGKHHQFSGTLEQRVDDFQRCLDDTSIAAIWCARGGYGTIHVIDEVDFSNFQKRPKWVIGYSDVTVLHSHLNRRGYVTIHATMPINLPKNTQGARRSLENALLSKQPLEYKIVQPIPESFSVEGILVGGNLSVLCSLLGSRSEIYMEDKVLIIEDLDEYLYHIDRMMMMLKRANYFYKIKALLVGGMTQMNDTIPFAKTPTQIIKQHTKGMDFPVVFGIPFGHVRDNLAFRLGDKIVIKADANSSVITLSNGG